MPSIYHVPFDFTPEEQKLYPSKFEEAQADYRLVRPAQADNYALLNPAHIATYFKEFVYCPFDAFTQEELWVLMCDTHNTVRYESLIYRGTLNEVPIRIGELFRSAIYYNAASIALAHNHPSGSSLPSTADERVTENIVEAGNLLGIHVLDHVIIGQETCTSLLAKGLGGFK